MITFTSLRHPKAQAEIRAAIFEAAAHASDEFTSKGTSYVRHVSKPNAPCESLYLRADYIKEQTYGFIRIYGRESKIITGTVIQAIGTKQFVWVNRLADSLASVGESKVW